MLRILASLGLSISVFGHEIKGAERAVVANLLLFDDLIHSVTDAELRADLTQQHVDLEKAAGRLFDIGGYIGGLMSRTESRDLKDLSVRGAIDRFTRQFSGYMSKQNVTFEVDVEPLELRTTPMHGAEFDSVLLNFLTNSIKSMKRAKVVERQVRIEARRVGRHVALAFEDNGLGIPSEIQDRIFDPFFTTTMGAEDDGVAGPGTGLGLKIVSDIAESYGGEVSVGRPSDGYTCRMSCPAPSR
jgi:signal transduction histidine kinase